MVEPEGDDIAIGRRRRILPPGHKSLRRIGPPTKKTTLDEALHAHVGHIRVVPRLHGKQGQRNEDFACGRKTEGE